MSQRTFSWMNPKLEVRETEKYGKGVFAKHDLEKFERLAIFGGHILTIEEESLLPKEFQDTGVQIAENFVLSTKERKEDADCFNHSCDPNAGFEGQIFLVAMKNIKKGEQVVFDYAMVLSSESELTYYSLKCECGSVNCRGMVTTEDWEKPELQERYHGFFQEYLKKKILSK